jgi:transcriptional regulator with GAF, ATPase, and Fis domain
MVPLTRSGPPLEKARYARARVVVTRGPNAGLALEAAGRTLSVGTAPECDLVLTDDTVSRRHCEIELSESGFRVRDVGSTNGVRSGGYRVYDVACTEPIELVLGETTLGITPLSQTEDRERVAAQSFGDVLGASARMRELYAELERFAGTNLSMLIEGETGSGKDVVAESIHRASSRAEGPYIVFDCSAVAPTLIESELFGHERGAFTGATNARVGVFEQAHGGSLFLDEIGELPKELQPKLLRALERREVKRLGSQKLESVDVRVLAATNRSLAAEVASGGFRQDLYYRIAGARVYVPPLRERLEDIPLLVEHFLKLDAPHVANVHVPEQVWEMFRLHRWPGNVRELRSAVQRMVVAPELALHSSDRAAASTESAAPSVAEQQAVVPLRIARRTAADTFERDYLRALLRRTQGNISRAAAIAEVSRQMVQKLLRKHDLDDSEQ